MRNWSVFEVAGHVSRVTTLGESVRVHVCANYSWVDKDGVRRHEEYWNEITILKKGMQKFALERVGEGDLVRARGRMRDESFPDRNGEKRYVTSRVADEFGLLSKKREVEALSDD